MFTPFGFLRVGGYTHPSGFMSHFYSMESLANVFQLSDGTIAVTTPADRLGYVKDLVSTANAIQATSGLRPYFATVPTRGRVNTLRNTDSPSDNANFWGDTGGTLTNDYETVDGHPGTRGQRTTGGAFSSIGPLTTLATAAWSPAAPSQGQVYTASCLMKTVSGTASVYMQLQETGGATGTQTSNQIFNLTTTPQWCTLSRTILQSDRTNLAVQFASSSAAETYDIVTAAHQLEIGSSRTAYQKVGPNQYDVLEPGGTNAYCLMRPVGNEVLTATLPDLGSNCTIAYRTDSGVTIIDGQTISGATNAPAGTRLRWWGYKAGGLTSEQEAFLNGYEPNFT